MISPTEVFRVDKLTSEVSKAELLSEASAVEAACMSELRSWLAHGTCKPCLAADFTKATKPGTGECPVGADLEGQGRRSRSQGKALPEGLPRTEPKRPPHQFAYGNKVRPPNGCSTSS